MSIATQFIGNIPEYYDKGLGPNLFDHYGTLITKQTVDTNPAAVLELAAGTGIVTRKLRDALDDETSLIATDLNQPMLDISAGKFDRNEHIAFQVVDAMDMPFADNSFDTIICQFGVMFFPDKEDSYREARRVLKDDGHYIFNVWGSWAVNPFAQLAHETIATFFEGEPPKFYEIPFGYDDEKGITAALKAAGFSSVKAERLQHTAIIHDIPAFARALIFGNPMAEEMISLGGNPDAAVDAVEAAIKEAFGATGTMPLEALFFTAQS